MVTFVHTADWQLGMRRHFLEGEAQHRFTQSRLDAISAIGRLAADQDAAFVVVAGDVFEHNQIERRTLLRALEALSHVPVPVLLLPGNHDPLDGGSVYKSREFAQRCPSHVEVLDDRRPRPVAPGVEVVGAPWSGKQPLEDLAGEACAGLEADGVTRVLVAHGGVDVLAPDPDAPATIRLASLEAALEDGRLDYVALGDRHSVTEVGATGRVWYSGAPEPTDYDERAPGYALTVELPDDVDGPPAVVRSHLIGTWSFRRREAEVVGADDVAALVEWLAEPTEPSRTIGKVGLSGTLALRDLATLEDALEDAGATYAALERWEERSDLVTAPDETDLDHLDVTGFVRAAVDDLRAEAAAGADDAAAATDALALLYRFAGGRE